MVNLSQTDQMFADLGLLNPSTGQLAFDPTGGTGYIYDRDDDDDVPTEFTTQDEIEVRGERGDRGARVEVPVRDEAAQNPWESDENPYKQRAQALEQNIPSPRQQLDMRYQNVVGWLDEQAKDAYLQLSSMRDEQGNPVYDSRKLAGELRREHERLLDQAKMTYQRALTQPIAQQYVAQDVINRVGGNATVSDIIDLPHPAAMEAVANWINKNGRGSGTNQQQMSHNEARDARFQARRESGVDAVETGSPLSRSIADTFAKLPPKDKIAYALRYQSN